MSSEARISRRRVLQAGGSGVAGLISYSIGGTGQPSKEQTISFESSSQGSYEFTVSGIVKKSTYDGASKNSGDDIFGYADFGSKVSGRVTEGKDSYIFTGNITEFRTDDSVTTYLNDQKVIDSCEPELPAPHNSLPNTVTIRSLNESRVDYKLIASENIKKSYANGASIENDDTTSNSVATGSMKGDADSYAFSKWILPEKCQFNGKNADVEVVLNGTTYKPNEIPGRPPHDNIITIHGIDDTHIDYRFTVDGEIERTYHRGSAGKADSIDSSANDGIAQSTVTGFVNGGIDTYASSGKITSFEYDGGNIEVCVEGTEIDPDEYGADYELRIEALHGPAKYNLSVDEQLDPGLEFNAEGENRDRIESRNEAIGFLHTGESDTYWFSNSIEKFEEVEGSVRTFVNGYRVPREQLSKLKKVVLKSKKEPADYTFKVSKKLVPKLEADTNSDNIWVDTVDENNRKASGRVGSGAKARDEYWYSGEIEWLVYDGPLDIEIVDNNGVKREPHPGCVADGFPDCQLSIVDSMIPSKWVPVISAIGGTLAILDFSRIIYNKIPHNKESG